MSRIESHDVEIDYDEIHSRFETLDRAELLLLKRARERILDEACWIAPPDHKTGMEGSVWPGEAMSHRSEWCNPRYKYAAYWTATGAISAARYDHEIIEVLHQSLFQRYRMYECVESIRGVAVMKLDNMALRLYNKEYVNLLDMHAMVITCYDTVILECEP